VNHGAAGRCRQAAAALGEAAPATRERAPARRRHGEGRCRPAAQPRWARAARGERRAASRQGRWAEAGGERR
jgi:hypothetical protein